ncbi:hypothetical protein EV421DRAFT_1113862 [Armillaria borealis]|uniref:Secreted protein n=1 Tax=Armillaria borealis TaxID=47425 RepID=A0AA39J5S2_9AGAR|nr:hypothetical protein EV421DRAFT_1113862 [Armillaria borealis]
MSSLGRVGTLISLLRHLVRILCSLVHVTSHFRGREKCLLFYALETSPLFEHGTLFFIRLFYDMNGSSGAFCNNRTQCHCNQRRTNQTGLKAQRQRNQLVVNPSSPTVNKPP